MSALADPTRRRVFKRLKTGPKPVGAIARGMPVSRPAVWQHLRTLKEAGQVPDRPEGTSASISSIRMDWARCASGCQFWVEALAASRAEVDQNERKREGQ